MRTRLTRAAIASGVYALLLTFGGGAAAVDAFDREPVAFEGGELHTWAECLLAAYDTCSGWTWVFSDIEGAVWGVVLDTDLCPGGCYEDWVYEVYLYTRCSSVPGRIGGVGLYSVDATACLTGLLYHSGPITVTRCTDRDHWTRIDLPIVGVGDDPFALTVEWGPTDPGTGQANPRIVTDNGIANLFCRSGEIGFPGCQAPGNTCTGWQMSPQRTYIYFTDLDGDGELDDLCALYGAPYGLAFPNVYGSYMTNNLIAAVSVNCTPPYMAEPSSWGRMKALFE